ncbi:MAG: hypothetical protein NVS1B7_2870 [Candidatus Saccharimonadales bacterium]
MPYNETMKALKFNANAIPFIITGTKRTTWRLLDDKNLSVDDEVEFINSATGEAFGLARLTQITIKRLADVDLVSDETEEAYSTLEQMIQSFRHYYGSSISLGSHIKIIQFDFAPYKKPRQPSTPAVNQDIVKLFADGGSRGNPGPSASGYVLLDINNSVISESGVYLGITTNNQAEYHALKLGLEAARQLGVNEVEVFMDSMLVVNQMKGIFKIKNRDLWPIHQAIQQLALQFKKISFTHIPRELNKLADAQVNETLDKETK